MTLAELMLCELSLLLTERNKFSIFCMFYSMRIYTITHIHINLYIVLISLLTHIFVTKSCVIYVIKTYFYNPLKLKALSQKEL